MGGEQHRVPFLVQAGDEVPQRLAQLYVHTGGGLVQHDDGRLVHQRLGDQHAALHAARKLAHVGVGLVGQAQVFEQLVNPGVVVLHTEIAGLEAQRLAHVEEGVEHQLLRHDAQLAAGIRVVGLHIAALHQHTATGGAGQARQNADEGGFAGAIGPEEPKKFALFNVQADLVQRLERAFGRGKGLGDGLE